MDDKRQKRMFWLTVSSFALSILCIAVCAHERNWLAVCGWAVAANCNFWDALIKACELGRIETESKTSESTIS